MEQIEGISIHSLESVGSDMSSSTMAKRVSSCIFISFHSLSSQESSISFPPKSQLQMGADRALSGGSDDFFFPWLRLISRPISPGGNAGWCLWQALIAETPKCRLLRSGGKVIHSVTEVFFPL